ncbi:hypothetical protein G9A89_020505 [Geosiphon pyriformis]|nr:hypothetical protein G9A89_020505 [Geosiphon pyriformis]
MKQAQISLRHQKLLQQAYPWEILSGYIQPHVFAHRLKTLNDALQLSNLQHHQLPLFLSRSAETCSTQCKPLLLPIILTAISTCIILPHFLQGMRYMRKDWQTQTGNETVINNWQSKEQEQFRKVQDAMVRWVTGMIAVGTVLSFIWIRGWTLWRFKKVSNAISQHLSAFNQQDNVYGINWRLLSKSTEEFIIIEQLNKINASSNKTHEKDLRLPIPSILSTETKTIFHTNAVVPFSSLSSPPPPPPPPPPPSPSPNESLITLGQDDITEKTRVTLVYQKLKPMQTINTSIETRTMLSLNRADEWDDEVELNYRDIIISI